MTAFQPEKLPEKYSVVPRIFTWRFFGVNDVIHVTRDLKQSTFLSHGRQPEDLNHVFFE